MLKEPRHPNPWILWEDVKLDVIDNIPHNVNGTKIFQVKFEQKDRMASTKGGRPWRKYFNSPIGGIAGIRRMASCKGSMKFTN